MHTYQKSENNLWTVGYYRLQTYVDRHNPTREANKREQWQWVPLSDHSSEIEAIRRVNFLNGGSSDSA